ncbi:DMT family transporter [Bacillus solitudinis]|uniref:DMT family transporter n=1 Tax=Bacillus solitudinis TaxID=2014074 RepID=UPI000C250881|nr:multidrug efflux SMR transporter [Bacillus solitudinis]
MSWIFLIIAAILEVVWIAGLKMSKGFTILTPSVITIILIIITFYFFSKSVIRLPIGTAYAIFAGIGAVGSALLGFFMFGEIFNLLKLFFLSLLILGIIGLKMSVTNEEG